MRSKTTQIKLNIFGWLISLGFGFQIPLTKFIHINKPDMNESFIVAIWHAHQCSMYGFKEVINRVNILISPSNDGQIITDACERLGYKVIRGSKGREGASKAVLKMVDALNNDDIIAITVDGPRGPNHVVKKGQLNWQNYRGNL